MKCRFCGEPAGFLKREHEECRKAFEYGQKYIRECIDYIYDHRDCMNISEVIADSASRYHISSKVLYPLLWQCWQDKAAEALKDGEVSEDEITILRKMLPAMRIDIAEIWQTKAGEMILAYGKKAIKQILIKSIDDKSLQGNLQEQIRHIQELYGFSDQIVKSCALEGWKSCVAEAYEDHLISLEEEKLLDQLAEQLKITQADAPETFLKLARGIVLRNVLNGEAVSSLRITNQLPVMLQKGEVILWLENDVTVYEGRVRRTYQGGSAGMSFRVAKGIYVRTGSYRGEPVETTESVNLGSGCMVITNKNIFWISGTKSVKLQAKKIATVIPVSDGVVIQKEGVTARPYHFITADPCFTYNLVINLNLL